MSPVPYPNLMLCMACDQAHMRRPLSSTEWARCRRCGSTLEHGQRFSLSTWLALTLTAAIVMVFANVFPVAVISLGGLESEATVWQSVVALADGPGAPVAIAAGMIVIGIPALQVLTLLWILSFAVAGRSCPYFVPAMRVLRSCKPWGMIEVCLLAILVALVKLSGFLHVVAGIGVAAIVVLAPLMAVITTRDAGDLWSIYEARTGLRYPAAPMSWADHPVACDLCALAHEGATATGGAGFPCSRCGSELRARKPDSILRTGAFLLAALVLYVPANLLPVMHTKLLGSEAESYDPGGRRGVLGFRLLGHCPADIHRQCGRAVHEISGYRIVAVGSENSVGIACGKDPLAEAGRAYRLLVHVGRPGRGPRHRPDSVPGARGRRAALGGIVFFGAVVVLTMLAAMSFDSRLAWKWQVRRG